MIEHYYEGEYQRAIAEAQELDLPDLFWTPLLYAAIYAEMGRTEQAKAQLAEALRQNPDPAARPRHYLGNYIFPNEVIERIMDGLRKAGLPDRGAKAEGQSPSIERDQDGIVATAWLSGAGWEGSRHTHIAA